MLFSCKIHHLLEYALYIYSSTWKLVVPTTVWSVPLIEAPKHASKRGFYLLHLFLPFFINFFTAVTNRTIFSCFQSVNMKILLVKKNIFSCWCTILPCNVACVLLSERQHDAFALGGNVSHMCHSGEGNFSDSGYTCGLMNHATSYRTTFHLKSKTVSISRNFWDFNVPFCILKLVGYFHGILVELPPPLYVSIQGKSNQKRDQRIGWNNSSVFRPQKRRGQVAICQVTTKLLEH